MQEQTSPVPPSQVLGVAIVGAGNIGARHARFWGQIEGATLLAVADADAGVAERLAAAHPPARAATLADLLADPAVSLVSVCVPTPAHKEVTLAALRAGKHVLCEKPLALNLADCDAMIAAADAAGVLLSVGHVVRFFPEYADAKAMLDGGAVGNPCVARTRRAGAYPKPPWFADAAQSGGVVGDLLIHDLDFLQWCFGPAVRVFAKIARAPGFECALVTLRHESGVISHAEGVWGEPGGFHAAFEIAGDAGLLTHDSRAARTLIAAGRDGGAISLPPAPLSPADDPYYKQIQAFSDAVRGTAPLAVPPADARSAVAVALTALESSRTGREVTL